MTTPVQTELLLELWHQTVQPAVWTAPHDTAAGMKAGDTCMGWRCPVCGGVEWNASTLDLNHGWDPDRPGRKPVDGGCHRLRLLANHAAADAATGNWPSSQREFVPHPGRPWPADHPLPQFELLELLRAEHGELSYDRQRYRIHGVPNNTLWLIWAGLLADGAGGPVLTDAGRVRLAAERAAGRLDDDQDDDQDDESETS